MTEHRLTPEQSKALEMFTSAKLFQKELTTSVVAYSHVTTTGTTIFVKGKMARSMLPHDDHWVWNQSKAQKMIEDSSQQHTIMKKFNSRKKRKSQDKSIPHLKLWMILVKKRVSETSYESINFLWCEKGTDALQPIFCTQQIQNGIQLVPINSIHQLVFLSEFMEPKVAKTVFGTPTAVDCNHV